MDDGACMREGRRVMSSYERRPRGDRGGLAEVRVTTPAEGIVPRAPEAAAARHVYSGASAASRRLSTLYNCRPVGARAEESERGGHCVAIASICGARHGGGERLATAPHASRDVGCRSMP